MSAAAWQPGLRQGLAALGLANDMPLATGLGRYLELLETWNRKFNLTAVRDPVEMVPRHILDSLAVGPHLPPGRLLDVGTGAGLPGIPLALRYPERQFTLLDSNGKKTRFVNQAVMMLGIDNVEVVKERVERYRPASGFEIIVSRAFASLADFVTGTRHLLAPGGAWLAMKGVYPDEEIAALPAGVALQDAHRLRVPGLTGERHLLELRQTQAAGTD